MMREWRRGGLVALLVLLGVIALTVALLAMALERPELLWLLMAARALSFGDYGYFGGLHGLPLSHLI